ncbi:neck protein [uncultured Caudovirales phage]|uniref:Neck protein n=1 Tax=uncultured Caudovirales phage TaxID=2100421 RepID=A0A6J5NYS1_9CAUD|nr:neck protein [uncultured Caudovirales phage]
MEQQLLENLIIEAIQIYGLDMYYIPRKLNNYDEVYGDDDQSSYETAYSIEMYIKSVDGFSGDGNFMSKFGIEIRDRVIFSVAQRRFSEEVGEFTTQVRPNEGDLIYFPLNNKCFQIKYVNKFEMFYQLGSLQTWELTCELFEYSGETLNTGIPQIDSLQTKFSTNILDWSIKTEDGVSLLTEDGDYITLEGSSINDLIPGSDNDEIQRESDQFVDFSAYDPFSEGTI